MQIWKTNRKPKKKKGIGAEVTRLYKIMFSTNSTLTVFIAVNINNKASIKSTKAGMKMKEKQKRVF